MRRLHVRRLLLLGLPALAAAAILLLPLSSVLMADGQELSVASYSAQGSCLAVQLHNNTKESIKGSAVATVTVGGQTETQASFATIIPAGETVTVNIYFSGDIQGITEGPDPIPQ